MSIPQRLTPDVNDLRKYFVGKSINEVPKPALVLDRARVRRHCQSLLKAVDVLRVGFRAHIKTHKTLEGVQLQIGDSNGDINLVVSTLAEIEHILPFLLESKTKGRSVNVLYGIPLPPSQVTRLAVIGSQLGSGSLSVLIDNAAQLAGVSHFSSQAGFAAGVFIKVDTGYHRAGLPPSGINKDSLITKLMELEHQGSANFVGLYSHSSLSYNDQSPSKAMTNLEVEIRGCLDALHQNRELFPQDKQITISVGASPQVTSVENLTQPGGDSSEAAKSLRNTMQEVMTSTKDSFRTKLELHAGVYSTLDVQQLSTQSRTHISEFESEIAISVIGEICSVYNNGEREQPEALAAVGTLGLGREPCFAYKGWGIVDSNGAKHARRLIVDRISQEHSIIKWEDGQDGALPPVPFEVGQSVKIYPNHACITGALYGWYLVVDSGSEGKGATEIVDVWVRASGW